MADTPDDKQPKSPTGRSRKPASGTDAKPRRASRRPAASKAGAGRRQPVTIEAEAVRVAADPQTETKPSSAQSDKTDGSPPRTSKPAKPEAAKKPAPENQKTTPGNEPPDAPQSRPPEPPKPPRRGLVAPLVVGLIGAGLVGAGVWYLGVLGPTSESMARTAQLEATVATLQSANAELGSLVTALDDRIALLESETATIDDRLSRQIETSAQLETVQSAVQAEQASIRSLAEAAAEQTDLASAMAAVNALQAAVSALDERLVDMVSAAAATAASPDATSTSAAQIGVLRDQIKAQILGELTPQIDAVVQRLAQLRVETTEQLAAMQTTVAGVAISAEQAVVRRSNLLLLFSDFETALDEGRPFQAPYEKLSAAGADNPTFAALAPFAPVGLPTSAALLDRLDELSIMVTDAPVAAESDKSWQDQLLDGARSFIKVTPLDEVGEPTGEDSLTPLRRAIAAQDWATAVSAWAGIALAGDDDHQNFGAALGLRAALPGMLDDLNRQIQSDRVVLGSGAAQ